MLDQIRHDIQARLDDLLADADKLRHALAALGSDARGTAVKPRQPRASPQSSPTSSTAPAVPSSTATERPRTRAASGTTQAAVMAALADGSAMTASDVASATGLARASVSTTLSKLSKTGAVTKAARGYQLASDTVAPNAPAAASRRAKAKPAAA